MKIELHNIKIKDLIKGYSNNDDEGVFAYDGKLDIRPKYQRNFVYNSEQQKAVIDTVLKGFPLNVMYWVVNKNNHFEVLDGQQRSISICEYCANNFVLDDKFFKNLTTDEQNKILDYELMIYFCEGTDKEKLEWFRVVNIAGERLFEQELRNAVYSGEWVSDAKKYFSKRNCVAYNLANKYLNCKLDRQEYLEKAIEWIINKEGVKSIEFYMATHQDDSSAVKLWNYFKDVISWVESLFPKYRKEMCGVEWGLLYNEFHEKDYDPKKLEEQVSKLMADEEVQKKKGIYTYVFTKDEKYLNLRTFDLKDKRTVYEKQKGICPICKQHFEFEEMDGDHIKSWSKGGRTDISNLQMLCKKCNVMKSNKI